MQMCDVADVGYQLTRTQCIRTKCIRNFVPWPSVGLAEHYSSVAQCHVNEVTLRPACMASTGI